VATLAPILRVAILAPMQPELRPLVRALSLRRSQSGDGTRLCGTVGRVEVIATTTGIGTRAAAYTTDRILTSIHVDHLIVAGIAGGIGPTVGIGDLVVPNLVLDLVTNAEFQPAPLGRTAPRGTLVTSDELLMDQGEIARLERQGVIAIDMETAAIAAVCEARHCPWSVFRAVSDRADDGSTDQAILGLAGPEGAPDFVALARFIIRTPWRIPELGRLRRGTRLATGAVASATLRALQTM
jgi:adenosylhomocysteine nucleosidase